MRLHTQQRWNRYRGPASVLLNKLPTELLPQQSEQFATFVFGLWVFITVFFTSPFNASRSNWWGQACKEQIPLTETSGWWESHEKSKFHIVSPPWMTFGGSKSHVKAMEKPWKRKHKHGPSTTIFRFVWAYPSTVGRFSGLFRFGLCFANSFHKNIAGFGYC